MNIFCFRTPLEIHFGGQANLFDSGRRQEKAALDTAKAAFPSLPEIKNLLLAAQKKFSERPFKIVHTEIPVLEVIFHGYGNLKLIHTSTESIYQLKFTIKAVLAVMFCIRDTKCPRETRHLRLHNGIAAKKQAFLIVI